MSDDWIMPEVTPISGNSASVADLPPHSEEAEKGVLGCVMVASEPGSTMSVCALTFPSGADVFYVDACRLTYTAMLAMVEASVSIDVITLSNQLKKAGDLDRVGGLAFLTGLQDATPSAANLGHYASIVSEKYTRRRVIAEAVALIGSAKAPGSTIGSIDLGVSLVAMAASAVVKKNHTIKELTRCVIDKVSEKHNSPEPTGLMTGIYRFDAMTGGLTNTDKWVIAARPSMGKTVMGATICKNVAFRHLDRGMASFMTLEMSPEQITQRMVASEAELNFRDIRSFKEDEFRKLTVACAKIGKANINILSARGWGMLQIIAQAKAWRADKGLSVLVIDHFGLIQAPDFGRRRPDPVEVATYNSRRMADLCEAAGCPVIILHQMNRSVESRSSSDPKMSDLSQSGAIEQDADLVSFLYQPDGGADGRVHEPTVKTMMTVTKNRDGETGSIPLLFFRRWSVFRDAPVDIPD